MGCDRVFRTLGLGGALSSFHLTVHGDERSRLLQSKEEAIEEMFPLLDQVRPCWRALAIFQKRSMWELAE